MVPLPPQIGKSTHPLTQPLDCLLTQHVFMILPAYIVKLRTSNKLLPAMLICPPRKHPSVRAVAEGYVVCRI